MNKFLAKCGAFGCPKEASAYMHQTGHHQKTARLAAFMLCLTLSGEPAHAQISSSTSWYFGRFPSGPSDYPQLGFDLQEAAVKLANSNNRVAVSTPVVTYIGNGDYSSRFLWQSSGCYGRVDPPCLTQEGNDTIGTATRPLIHRYHDKKTCSAPSFENPIYPLTGSKRNQVDLGRWLNTELYIAYDTRRQVPGVDPAFAFKGKAIPSFGSLWESNLHRHLFVQHTAGQYGGANITAVYASRGAGEWVSFLSTGGAFVADGDIPARLTAVNGGWVYTDLTRRVQERYDSNGNLTAATNADGATLTFTYSSAPGPGVPAAGLLVQVSDHFGRSVQFAYEQPGAAGSDSRIVSITAVSSQGTIQVAAFDYDNNGNLWHTTWPDSRKQTFVYERSDIPWALTGVVDENDVRSATYGYDSQGLANDTQRAGGVGHAHVTWASPPGWSYTDTLEDSSSAGVVWRDHYWHPPQSTVVTLANGQHLDLSAVNVLGANVLAGSNQPAGSGCAAASSAQAYDPSGNVSYRDDFNGYRTCYAYDSNGRETVRVEGLANTAICDNYTSSGVVLPAGARKISTQWHPDDWRLRVKAAEPGRLTTFVYNGQPDPFNNGAIASCAPASAKLPDSNKPIVLLCKQVEQATGDLNGQLAFGAALEGGVANRASQWTYNQYGQVLTAKGARTDLDDTTTYEYYSDTVLTGGEPNAVGHTIGDLKKITNALGSPVQYTKYNSAGQVLESIDANSVVTSYVYDARQRITREVVGGQATTFEYWPTGMLRKASRLDASASVISYLQYTYDDAHRLYLVEDNLGNSIKYTLDNAGNRTAEETKDAGSVLRRQLGRSIDALNRVQQTTGRLQ